MGGKTVYVHVRRAMLCPACSEKVEDIEDRVSSGALLARRDDGDAIDLPSSLNTNWFHDPVEFMRPKAPAISGRTDIGLAQAQQAHHGSRGWRALRGTDGRVVYYNIITNRSTFERPMEL
jgi:hypothetical protein